jgi:hypothetical protein
MSIKYVFYLFCIVCFTACHKNENECHCDTGRITHSSCGFMIGAKFVRDLPPPYNATVFDSAGVAHYTYYGAPVKYCYNYVDTPYVVCTYDSNTFREYPVIELCNIEFDN